MHKHFRAVGWAVGWAVVLGCVVGLLARCDLPTEGMDVSGSATVSVPIFAEKTYEFLGDGRSNDVLIDTTTAAFERLFAVGEGDRRLFIEHETGAFEVGALDEALGKAERFFRFDERLAELVAGLGGIAEQRFEGEYREDNEVVETEPADLEPVPIVPQGDEARVPFPDDAVFNPPGFGPFSAEQTAVKSVTLTEETKHDGRAVNTFEFTLRSRAGRALTDGNGNPPRVAIVRGDGSVIAAEDFGRTIPPGGSARAEVEVAGETLEPGMELWFALDEPAELETYVTPLRYQSAVLTVEDAELVATRRDLALEGSVDFAGIEIAEGTATVSVENAFDVPIQVDAFVVRNRLEDVPELPAGFEEIALRTEGHVVEARSTADIPLDLAGVHVAERVDVTLRASLYDPPARDVRVSADDFVRLVVSGNASIERMHFRPGGEVFETRYAFAADAERARFERGDFVEVEEGTLHIEDLTSEPDLAFDELALTSPSIRRPPYEPDDRLAVRFEGTAEDPAHYRFAQIGRDDPPRSVAIPLDGLRLYPTDNQIEAALTGRTEASNEVRTVRAGDEFSVRLLVRDLALREVAAHMKPFSVPLTEDADGDGRLDVMDERERVRTSLDLLGGLHVEGLDLEGNTLSIHLTTNIAADATLYGALLGTRGDGRTVYLSGRGDLAVSPADSIVGSLARDGASIPAERLIRFELEGAPPGKTVTRTFVLDATNSTVDDFISGLPEDVWLVGKAVVPATEQRVRLRDPIALELGFGVSTPVRLRSDFVVRDTVEADFSGLPDLADPEQRTRLTSTELEVAYENDIPLGAEMELVFLDAADRPTVTVDEALRLKPAPKSENGTASGFRAGVLSADLDEDDLRRLGESERLVLVIHFRTGEGPASRVRATDPIRFSIRGSFEGAFETGTE